MNGERGWDKSEEGRREKNKGCQSFINMLELSGTAIFSSIKLSQNTSVQISAPPFPPSLQIQSPPPPHTHISLYLSVCPITRQSFSIKQINWLDILISVVFDLVEYITDVYISESR